MNWILTACPGRLGVSKARPSSALSQAQQAEPEVDEFLARCAQRCAQDAKAAEQAPETETPEAENEPGTCQRHWIELTALPAVFRSATVEKMCRRYGDISGPYRDDKTDGQFRVGYSLREIATTAVKDLNGRFAAKGIPARAKFLPNSTTEKQKVFVDELLVGRGCAIKGWETDREADQRRELFFWNLPDLTPAKLFLWLQGGSKQDLDSRAPIELFESHEWRKCSHSDRMYPASSASSAKTWVSGIKVCFARCLIQFSASRYEQLKQPAAYTAHFS